MVAAMPILRSSDHSQPIAAEPAQPGTSVPTSTIQHAAARPSDSGEWLWEQWTAESARNYSAFRLYVSLGTSRTLAMVARTVGLANSYVGAISRRWQWGQRVAAYDKHVAVAAAGAELAGRIDMSRRQIRLGTALQSKAYTSLSQLSPSTPLTAAEIALLAKTGTQIERLARGESTQNTAVRGGVTIEWAGDMPRWAPGQKREASVAAAPENFSEPGNSGTIDAEIVDD